MTKQIKTSTETDETIWAALAAISQPLDAPERLNIPTYWSGTLGRRVTVPA